MHCNQATSQSPPFCKTSSESCRNPSAEGVFLLPPEGLPGLHPEVSILTAPGSGGRFLGRHLPPNLARSGQRAVRLGCQHLQTPPSAPLKRFLSTWQLSLVSKEGEKEGKLKINEPRDTHPSGARRCQPRSLCNCFFNQNLMQFKHLTEILEQRSCYPEQENLQP